MPNEKLNRYVICICGWVMCHVKWHTCGTSIALRRYQLNSSLEQQGIIVFSERQTVKNRQTFLREKNSLYRTRKPHTHIYRNSWQWNLPSRLTYWRGRWHCWLVEGQELGMRYHISWENMEPPLLSWAAAGMSLTLLLTPLDLMEFM